MQIIDLDDEMQAVEDVDNGNRSEETRDWKLLTGDLIHSIANRFVTLGDYAGMRLVCSSWGLNIEPMPKKTGLLLPVLLCYHEPNSRVRLFDVTHSRIYANELPTIVKPETFLFSSNEFIVNELDKPEVIVLTNIFTQTMIWLTPPLGLMYDPIFKSVGIDERHIIRIVISPPSLQRFVVVYQLNGPMFGYCEIEGNNQWSVFEFGIHESIASMLFYKGDLYAVLSDYRPITVTFHPEINYTPLNADGGNNLQELPWLDLNIPYFEEILYDPHVICVLADAGDDLLLVIMSPCRAKVHILCWDFRAKKWMKAPSSIGGRAVFVSYKGFLASMFPCDGFWAKPDRVYVVDILPGGCLEYTLDGTYQVCYDRMKLENITFPDPMVWIFPKFSNVG